MFKIKQAKIQNLKNIDPDGLVIEEINDVNVFIGKNGSGKSSILKAIRKFFTQNYNPGPIFKNSKGEIDGQPTIELCIETHPEILDRITDPELKYWFTENHGGCWIARTKDQVKFIEFEITRKIRENKSQNVESKYQQLLENNSIKLMASEHIERHFHESLNQVAYISSNPRVRAIDLSNPRLNVDGTMLIDEWQNTIHGQTRKRFEDFAKKFGDLDINFTDFSIYSPGKADINAVQSNIGEKELSAITIPFLDEGQGAQDMVLIFWAIFNNDFKLIIIDEPENSKHPKLQRKLFSLLLKYCNDKQFFISTHSPIFSQFNKSSSIYLVSNPSRDKGLELKQIPKLEDYTLIKNELGLRNSDLFLSNAILFVEGETEKNAINKIFKKLSGKTPYEAGVEIISAGSVDKVNDKRLKEFLNFIERLNIITFIFLDREGEAEKNRADIIRTYKMLFPEKDVQYVLWENDFEKEFTVEQLHKSFTIYKELTDSETDITVEMIKRALKNKNPFGKWLEKILHQNKEGDLNKPLFGSCIGDAIVLEISENAERSITPVEEAVSNLITRLE